MENDYFFLEQLTISTGPCSIPMLNYQRVCIGISKIKYVDGRFSIAMLTQRVSENGGVTTLYGIFHSFHREYDEKLLDSEVPHHRIRNWHIYQTVFPK